MQTYLHHFVDMAANKSATVVGLPVDVEVFQYFFQLFAQGPLSFFLICSSWLCAAWQPRLPVKIYGRKRNSMKIETQEKQSFNLERKWEHNNFVQKLEHIHHSCSSTVPSHGLAPIVEKSLLEIA